MRDFKSPIKEFSSRNLLATVALTALLAGCSSVPDAINPVEWYKGARDAITGDDEKKQDTKDKPTSEKAIPGEKDSFPKLSSVPAKPKSTVEQERKRIADGLVADREESRKYSNEVIRRQGDSASSLPAPPPVAKVQPTPAPIVKATPMPKPEPKAMLKPAPKPVVMAPKPAPVMQSVASVNTGQSVSPKLRVAPPSPMLKIPAVNPNSPKMGTIPGLAAALGQNETVIVSGSGVQTMNTQGQVRQMRSRRSAGKVNVAGVNSLNQLNVNDLQGSYQVATILFSNGSAKVGARDRRVLRQVIAQHKQVGGTLRIVGHASRRTKTNDPIRHKMANFQVSTARAERVAKELVKMGVKANKLFVGSVSDNEPRYYEYMPSGEAGNRRTEIYIDF
ncbi:MAG: OmpA family protein [Rhodospirillaceae bacterium]|jgi:flagellar motor protein MotB|nr:OmpA family protein [Rhodospirillaceae bacterium]MBT4589453.1 OmpA family protein [Rhodospirillaceae bacterium]MBT4937845.1 OmpA family protein [Rhodospirillaceae bacterium]MBT7268775.1 OmpA family protein [Rhodospirillaceae bacterium]